MKVAILGGTGKLGGGLAKHISKKNEVIIGSRDRSRAEAAAKAIPGVLGMDYPAAGTEADVVVFAIPYAALRSAKVLSDVLSGKLVVSAINPMKMQAGMLVPELRDSSAAEELAKILPGSEIATGFNNISATFLNRDEVPEVDILIAADSSEAYEMTATLVRTIQNMRPLYAGPLSMAGIIESITPLELNVAKLNGTGSLGPRFVSRRG